MPDPTTTNGRPEDWSRNDDGTVTLSDAAVRAVAERLVVRHVTAGWLEHAEVPGLDAATFDAVAEEADRYANQLLRALRAHDHSSGIDSAHLLELAGHAPPEATADTATASDVTAHCPGCGRAMSKIEPDDAWFCRAFHTTGPDRAGQLDSVEDLLTDTDKTALHADLARIAGARRRSHDAAAHTRLTSHTATPDPGPTGTGQDPTGT